MIPITPTPTPRTPLATPVSGVPFDANNAPADSEQRAKIVNTAFAGTRTRAELCENPSAPLVCVIADTDETRISVPANTAERHTPAAPRNARPQGRAQRMSLSIPLRLPSNVQKS